MSLVSTFSYVVAPLLGYTTNEDVRKVTKVIEEAKEIGTTAINLSFHEAEHAERLIGHMKAAMEASGEHPGFNYIWKKRLVTLISKDLRMPEWFDISEHLYVPSIAFVLETPAAKTIVINGFWPGLPSPVQRNLLDCYMRFVQDSLAGEDNCTVLIGGHLAMPIALDSWQAKYGMNFTTNNEGLTRMVIKQCSHAGSDGS